MELKHTKALLASLQSASAIGTYALAVGCGSEEATLFSADANEETYFDAASITKVVATASLILHAVSSGKLSLDSTLDAFFDNVPTDKKPITVRHLLTHTSGIVRFSDEIPIDVAADGHDAIAQYFMAHPLPYPIGNEVSYSCFGYILLGFIIEKVYRMPLDEAFARFVKELLGLTRSRFNIAVDDPRAAICYRRKEVGDYRVDDQNAFILKGVAGNAGLFVTLTDMRRFVHAVLLKDNCLYAPSFFTEAERDYTPDLSVGRGLGWLIVDKRYQQTGNLFPAGSFGHCGHTGQSFFLHRDSGLYVILLTDATRRASDYNIVMQMRERIHNAVYADLTEGRLR